AHIVACNTVWTHRRADDHPAVLNDLRGHKPDTPDIRVPILFTKPQALREMRAHHIAIKHGNLPSVLEEKDREHLGGRRLASTAQPREPDAHPLPVPGRI